MRNTTSDTATVGAARTEDTRKSPDPETDGKMVNIRTVPVKTIPRSVQFLRLLNDKQKTEFLFLNILVPCLAHPDP